MRRVVVDAPQHKVTLEEQISFIAIVSELWRIKWFALIALMITAVVSVYVALQMPNIYRTTTILAPATEKKAGLGGIGSQLGGLASLAGVNLSSMGAVDKTDLALELLKSKQFLGEFIAANDMLIPLMAAKSYDLATKQFVIDDEVYDVQQKVWVRQSVLPRQPEPSLNEAADVLGELMDVNKEKTTGIVRLSLEHMSPEMVQHWTTQLVKALNSEVRRRDIEEAQQSLQYLEAKLREASITEVRDSIAQLIEERTKTLMMANIRDEYVLSVVDPAFLPDEKFKPRRAAIVLMSMFAVSLLLMMIGYFRIVFRLKSTADGLKHV